MLLLNTFFFLITVGKSYLFLGATLHTSFTNSVSGSHRHVTRSEFFGKFNKGLELMTLVLFCSFVAGND
jgi:hypothetical protein